MSSTNHQRIHTKFEKADPTTIQRKFLVGYQGWFTCRGDGAELDGHDWSHWLKDCDDEGSAPDDRKFATDLWPDMSRYPPSEQYPVPGFKHKSGEQAFLFSSCNPRTVSRHFNWMACHGIDGAFLQRFVGQCDPLHPNYKTIIDWRDKVGENVRLAAEAEGRVFSVMYDVSGADPTRVQQILQQDWLHLIREKCMLDSPNYLHERGKPVVCLSGFGFSRTRHDPDTVGAIISFFRESTPGGAYIIAGVPAHWRTGDGDSDPNPEFLKLWLDHVDAISPWTVGRYKDEKEATRYANETMWADIETLAARSRTRQGALSHIDYMPVVLPGGSGYNMSGGKWAFNDIKREGGRFLWRQIYNATKNGSRIIYGATWDEYDEGTALMPAVENKLLLPISHVCPLLSLDEDGYSVPADWYMRICGLAAGYLRGEYKIQEEFPFERLRNYRHSLIRMERQYAESGSLVQDELPPPPPYSKDESASLAAVASRQPLRATRPRPLPPVPAGPGIGSVTPFLLDKESISLVPMTAAESFRDRANASTASSRRRELVNHLLIPSSETVHPVGEPSTMSSNVYQAVPFTNNENGDSRTAESRQPESGSLSLSSNTLSPTSSTSSITQSPISEPSTPSGRTKRLSIFMKKGKGSRSSGSSIFSQFSQLSLEDKTAKAEEKRRKKEDSRAKTERLAEQLKTNAKERARLEANHSPTSTSSAERRKKEPGAMYGGIAGVMM